MTPKEDLFELIKSLSGSEKRYFKLQNNSGGNHILLFDEIDSQNKYDETGIKGKFAHKNFIKQLTYTKNYLYNSIINSLISYYGSSSSEAQLINLVIKLRILFKKALFKQYFRELEKAKKKAEVYEKFYILLEILRLSRLISETKNFRKYNPELLYEEEDLILMKIDNLSKYSQLFNRSQRLKRQVGISGNNINIKKADEILNNKLLFDPSNALSTQAKEYYYHIKQVLYSIKGDRKKQFEACTKRLKVIEDNIKPFLDDIVNVRKEALYTLIEISIDLKKRDEFKMYSEKYYLVSGKSNSSKIDYEIISNFTNLMYVVSTEDYIESETVVRNIKFDLIKYKGKLDRDMELESMFLLVKYYFNSGQFNYALQQVNELLSHPIVKYRRDIYTYSRIMNLLIHYELGNFLLAEYLAESIRKALKNDKELYNRELLAVDIIDKIFKRKPGKNTNTDKDISTLQKLQVNTPVYYYDPLPWILRKSK